VWQGVAGGGVQLSLVTLYTTPYCFVSISLALSHRWESVKRNATLSSGEEQEGRHTVQDLEWPADATSVQCPPYPPPCSVCV